MLDEINIIFALPLILLGFRFEFGLLTHSFTLHYSLILLIGLEIVKNSVLNLVGQCVAVWYCANNTQLFSSILLLLLLYDSLSTLVTGKYLMILISKIVLIGSVYSLSIVVYTGDREIWFYYTCMLLTLLTVMMIIERVLHREEFRYGCVHQRYCYIVVGLYMAVATMMTLQYLSIAPAFLHIHTLLLVGAFNYHYQLNVLYKLTHWEYSTFIRSGMFPRILLIVDYYEIPDAKI
jgi:hypothetical protein